jgi:hypothetical protein
MQSADSAKQKAFQFNGPIWPANYQPRALIFRELVNLRKIDCTLPT